MRWVFLLLGKVEAMRFVFNGCGSVELKVRILGAMERVDLEIQGGRGMMMIKSSSLAFLREVGAGDCEVGIGRDGSSALLEDEDGSGG